MDVSFFIGVGLGIAYYYVLSEGRNNPESEKKVLKAKNFLGKLIPSIKFTAGGYEVHIHHWLYLLVIFLIVFIFFKGLFYDYPIIEGFLIGGIVEGLMYKNRFEIFKKLT